MVGATTPKVSGRLSTCGQRWPHPVHCKTKPSPLSTSSPPVMAAAFEAETDKAGGTLARQGGMADPLKCRKHTHVHL